MRARYHLRPHRGSFDEPSARRVGYEAEHWKPAANSLGEEPAEGASLPSERTWLNLPDPSTRSLQVRPEPLPDKPFYPVEGGGTATTREKTMPTDDGADSGTAVSVLLRNASDEPNSTNRSKLLGITEVSATGPRGSGDESISVDDGEIEIDFDARPKSTCPAQLEFRDPPSDTFVVGSVLCVRAQCESLRGVRTSSIGVESSRR